MTRFTSTDPATEATNWEGEAASPAQVQAAVDAARAASPPGPMRRAPTGSTR